MVGQDVVARYLGPGTRLVAEAGGVCVVVPSRFASEMIERRLGAALREASGGAVRYEVADLTPGGGGVSQAGRAEAREVAPRVDPGPRQSGGPASGRSDGRPVGRPGGRPVGRAGGRRSGGETGQTLDGFVVGASNRFAFTAISRVASGEEIGAGGPVFLYGPCGVGKSHLLNAAVRRFRESRPGARARVVTAEVFTNEYITAIRTNTIEAFHRRYRRVDLLCIDDVHFLASKGGTQKELLHTFDQLGVGGGRIVLASDEHPGEIRQFSEALVSRFVSGSLVKIDRPDRETRRAMIERFALEGGLMLEPAALAMLESVAAADAGGRGVSVRDLAGLVNRLRAYLSVMVTGGASGGLVTAATVEAAIRAQGGLASRALDGMVAENGPRNETTGGKLAAGRPVSIGVVVDRVCETLEVTRDDLAGRGRHPRVVLARAAVTLLARRLTRNSYPEIAGAIGRRNHSTVITAHRRIERQMSEGEVVGVGLATDGLPISVLMDRIEREARASV